MSFPSYPEFRPSVIEWLPEVPAHWTDIAVKRLAKLPITNGVGEAGAYDDPSWPRYLRVTDIDGARTLRNDTFKSLPPEVAAKAPVAVGDLLIAAVGATYGKSYLHMVDIGPCCYAGYLIRFAPDESLDPSFAAYWTESASYWAQVQSRVVQSTVQNFSAGKFRELAIALPKLEEQLKIAAFLDRETAKIDALIAEQEKLLALLAEKRQATISHAVTRGLDYGVPMKRSGIPGLEEVPQHWDVTRLKFIADVQTGIAKGKDVTGKKTIVVPYLRVANVQEGHLALEHIATIEVEPEQLDRYRLQSGDVLMNEGGDFDKLGRGAIWNGEIPDCIHQNHVFAVRPHGVSPEWLNEITGSRYAQFYFMGRAKQSTNLASISSSNIMELPVVVPPTEEQERILAFVRRTAEESDPLRDNAMRSIVLLRERRAALITAAVTGQIDVRSASVHQ